MIEIEVFITLNNDDIRVGTLYRQPARERETVSFEYHLTWIKNPKAFSLEPALQLGEGRFHLGREREIFGSIGDSAPDTWGRRLMQLAERRRSAISESRPRTLQEVDYLLGVTDFARLGALRFRHADDEEFQAPLETGVPQFMFLGKLMASADRIERDQHSDEDIKLIFAPGSSLGGARPKASVIDNDGNLVIAKFPKETDQYNLETWEHISLYLAEKAGIRVARHQLLRVNERPVLLSWRFDRDGTRRLPFLSALSMLGLSDGERSSYPEIVDEMMRHGADVKQDCCELFRRMVFNILISNVDDHLRNHGFLWFGQSGWRLSPAYDLNPTPEEHKARILMTKISLDDATCSIELALEQAGFFGMKRTLCQRIVKEVAVAVSGWRQVAMALGESKVAIERMSSAFEHGDLERALNL